jgi:hypothetical protein
MNKIVKQGALALSLLAGAALMTTPAMANHHGRYGGWGHRDHYARNYYRPHGYAYRGYAYNSPRYSYYGDPYYYDYGPGVGFGRPGASIWFGF